MFVMFIFIDVYNNHWDGRWKEKSAHHIEGDGELGCLVHKVDEEHFETR